VDRKLAAFVALAVALAALFVHLGFWQLERRGERRASNAALARQLAQSPSPIAEVRATGAPVHRRAVVTGVADFEHEFVLTGRSRNGSPGVHIFTPVKVAGLERAILVNRGWVYAPDAATVDLSRWRETRTRFAGYTLRLPRVSAVAAVKGRGLRSLNAAGVEELVPYPVDEVYLVARDSADAAAPVRLDAPALDEGPHLSYAIQWFCFAAIALVGAAIVVHRARREGNAGSTGA
jgi:surfeit locus 1 family protein